MKSLVLYCKSYCQDLLRIIRLAKSIEKYNIDKIPFYLSVPEDDLELFKINLHEYKFINILSDQQIILANAKIKYDKYLQLPGYIGQQIVKSEFWRLGLSENYLCLDSDCEFIRDFYFNDFIDSGNNPYTVISESKELFQFCDRYNYPKVRRNFINVAEQGKDIFGRKGRNLDFGPIPLVWSKKVWQILDEKYLAPQNITIVDLITKFSSEIQIYGESLLKYLPIKLIPIEPLFKVYHYESQYFFDKKRGITEEIIAKNYLGIVKQSNWDNLHYGKQKNILSRVAKQIKRLVRYLSV